jgi:hypothetical protein
VGDRGISGGVTTDTVVMGRSTGSSDNLTRTVVSNFTRRARTRSRGSTDDARGRTLSTSIGRGIVITGRGVTAVTRRR